MDENKNISIEELYEREKKKQLEKNKQAVQATTSKESEADSNKQLELDYKRAEEHIEDIRSSREERKKYAQYAFWFMCGYIAIVVSIVIFADLDSIPLTTLIATIPTSMALFGWVLKGLFPADNDK